MPEDVDPPLERRVLTCAGRAWTWGDVVGCAQAWGDWAAVERRADAGLAAAAGSPPPSAAAVNERSTAFRYAHGLISADDTSAWFGRWGILVGAWLAHVRRDILRAQAPPGAAADGPRASGAERAAAAWIEGVCSGALEDTARRLAARLAVREALGEDGEPTPDALREAQARFTATVAGPEATAAELVERRLDWTRLELRTVTLADEDAARELIHCVRRDGRDLAAVAAEAELPVQAERIVVADAPAELAGRLAGAQPGELFGPLSTPQGHRVVVVAERRAPHPDDTQARERAAASVVQRALRTEVARRVTWNDPLS